MKCEPEEAWSPKRDNASQNPANKIDYEVQLASMELTFLRTVAQPPHARIAILANRGDVKRFTSYLVCNEKITKHLYDGLIWSCEVELALGDLVAPLSAKVSPLSTFTISRLDGL